MQHLEQLIFSLASPLRSLAPALLLLGIAIVLAAVVWLAMAERRKASAERSTVGEARSLPPASWLWLAPLVLLVVAGGVLRLEGIGDKSLNHMEVYIPGMPLPAGISEPPPRHDWYTALTWGFFKEPHPVGYFLMMFAWTKLFGVGVAALRLPSALLGVLSIPVMYRLGSLVYDRKVGLIAAGFLAFHGFHIHTSMWARMFVPESFLGMVATWLLLEILRSRRHRLTFEALYVLVAFIGFNTEWFFWPLIGTHFLFVLIHYQADRETHRLIYVQVLAMLLGSYTLSQVAATAGLAGSGERPSLEIIREFLAFGLFYHEDTWSVPHRTLPLAFVVAAFVVGVGLLWRGFRVRPVRAYAQDKVSPLAWQPLCVAAGGMAILMASVVPFATTMSARPKYLPGIAAIVIFPLAALFAIPFARNLGPRIRSWFESIGTRYPAVEILISPIAFLAFVPFVMVCAGAFIRPMVDRQALIAFVPYVLIFLAAGAAEVVSHKRLAVPVAAVLIVLFVGSTLHFRGMPQTNRDYKTLAELMTAQLKPNDVIFVVPGKWYITPFFYYIDQSRLVTDNFPAYSEKPGARVWIVRFQNEKTNPQIAEALTGLTLSQKVEARLATGELYER